uniref:Guanylate cyclase domain-containing protein n=1 Tax=Parascaris univalens TaxID=6257 RepID=A0A915C459_PARUN
TQKRRKRHTWDSSNAKAAYAHLILLVGLLDCWSVMLMRFEKYYMEITSVRPIVFRKPWISLASFIGLSMPRYCFFRDAVYMASKIESGGKRLLLFLSKYEARAEEYYILLAPSRFIKRTGQRCTISSHADMSRITVLKV